MTAREERGLELSKSFKIYRKGKVWFVPSQSGNGKYEVTLDPQAPKCTCPDYELHQGKCKHIYAVQFILERRTKIETDKHGNTQVTETVKLTKRVTYKQNWPAYNAAQSQEKAQFALLLNDLCKDIQDPIQTMGRPRYSLKDLIFSAAYKVYSTVSGRRFMSDLSEAHAKGYVTNAPHYTSIFRCFENAELTPIFRSLITKSSLPLKSVETDFAVDASGFSTVRTMTWFEARYGHNQDVHDWLKVHLMTGIKTNVVTSVEISGPYAGDAPYFPSLVKSTAQHFQVSEVSADKGYSSHHNLKVAERHGAVPYIPFKSNTVESAEQCSIWAKMFHFYNFNREQFLEHYHKRSNVESTFNMIKAKFGEKIRSKTEVAQINEALAKVLCHNICVVIQSMFELGIDPTFASEIALDAKLDPI